MLTIWFEPHATTTDNEMGRASGWYDVDLSPKGIKQAKELGKRRSLNDFDAVFCSDLQRAYKTAILAFGPDTQKIFQDWRLRECNYGDLTGEPKHIMDKERLKRISKPFPHGESFEVANDRMTDFLNELQKKWDGKTVLIIGHRATHYGLETFVAHKSLKQCVEESLSWTWQPGWKYQLQ